MILNMNGEKFTYEGKTYCIGDRVVATDESDYEGLRGIITEICDGDDKDTDNEAPDIYCSFDVPTDEDAVRKLEEQFSKLYGEKKTVDDLALDLVIMAPSMIRVTEEQRNGA